MSETIVELAQSLVTSPWIYVVLFALSAIDGFFPAVPAESVVIIASVFAAQGEPNLFLIIACAALGAFTGDHISYLIGRTGGTALVGRIPPGSRRRAAFDRARRALAERGGHILVVARYIPGGRTAVTLTMGTVAYPLHRFSGFDAVAAVAWGIYSALLGYLGGMTFEHDPIKGVLVGIGFATAITVVVEVVRHLRRRPRHGVTRECPDERGELPHHDLAGRREDQPV